MGKNYNAIMASEKRSYACLSCICGPFAAAGGELRPLLRPPKSVVS